MSKETGMSRLAENLVKPMENEVSGQRGVAKKKEILRLGENLQKPLVKQGFGQEHQVARKKRGPWSPAARHGIGRGTLENQW